MGVWRGYVKYVVAHIELELRPGINGFGTSRRAITVLNYSATTVVVIHLVADGAAAAIDAIAMSGADNTR